MIKFFFKSGFTKYQNNIWAKKVDDTCFETSQVLNLNQRPDTWLEVSKWPTYQVTNKTNVHSYEACDLQLELDFLFYFSFHWSSYHDEAIYLQIGLLRQKNIYYKLSLTKTIEWRHTRHHYHELPKWIIFSFNKSLQWYLI